MAKNKYGLDVFIEDLKKTSKNFDKLLEKQYDDVVGNLLVVIGQTTAYDTGVARDLIKKILKDLGRADLSEEINYNVFEHWKKRERREKEDSKAELKKSQGSYIITIEDEGFFNQQQGKVSEQHPRQDPSVIPYNVDFCMDKMQTSGDIRLDTAIDNLKDAIVNLIEFGGM